MSSDCKSKKRKFLHSISNKLYTFVIMNIYRLLKVYTRCKNLRLKAMGLLCLHLLHIRYTSLYLDPVLGCNIRCKMCYFSDEQIRREMHGSFSMDDIRAIAKSLFPYLLKLQLGCGAEPTIYPHLKDIVVLGKQYGVKYISMTTNGNLLTETRLRELVSSGLDEITISLHGMTKNMYESLMQGANFDKFKRLIAAIKAVKQDFPKFKVRCNYTINEDNVDDLKYFDTLIGTTADIVQMRPIQKIGESAYNNFSMKGVIEKYDDCLLHVVDYCNKNGIVCLYPTLENILALTDGNDGMQTNNTNQLVNMIPHFYLSPNPEWKEKIDPYKENFYDYCRKTKRIKQMLKYIFTSKDNTKADVTKSLNYNLK